jgi:hypothetical protein
MEVMINAKKQEVMIKAKKQKSVKKPEAKRLVGRPGCRRKTILNGQLKEMVCMWTQSIWLRTGSHEHSNKCLGTINAQQSTQQ